MHAWLIHASRRRLLAVPCCTFTTRNDFCHVWFVGCVDMQAPPLTFHFVVSEKVLILSKELNLKQCNVNLHEASAGT